MSRAAIAIGLVVLLAVILAIIFGGPIVGYWKQRTADAEAGQEQAVDDAVGRGLEVEGTKAIADAAAQDRTSVVIIRETAHALESQARADVDASSRLPDSVLDRVRAGDVVLCDSGVECRSGSAAATD